MAAASETESLHDNMTRIRMKMVQRKLANERERLQRPESSSSDSHGGQFKLQQALIRRQQLLDKLKLEQTRDEQRTRSCSPRPRRRLTASTLPPPSRRSLPPDLLRGMSRAYHFNWYNSQSKDMVPNNYIIEHQYRQAEPLVTRREVELPPIIQMAAPPPPPPQITAIQPAPQVIQQIPSVTYRSSPTTVEVKGPAINKSDFMDMMMLQNAQMHHMVMQQMMLQNMPGSGWKMPSAEVPLAPVIRAAPTVMPFAAPPPPPPPAPVVHHMQQTLPPLEPRYPVSTRVYNNSSTFYDDGSNYFTYH